MRISFQFLLSVLLLLGSTQLLFAQDDFYNRDSSGYTYRIGPVLPKIQRDWQLGTLGRDFTFGFNPSGVNIENYVLSLLLTTAITALERKDRLGERMVKAIVMGIHFARAHREETERILDGLRKREPEAGSVRYESLTRMPIKPYPTLDAVANAYELCLMKIPEAKDFSPLALWDTHYLRNLDQSGFIDGLYR